MHRKELMVSPLINMKVFKKNKVEMTKWIILWSYFGLTKWYDLVSCKVEIRLFGFLIKKYDYTL